MAKAKKANGSSEVNGEREIRLELTGTRHLIMHNSRLANPLDPYTQAIAAIAKKRSKTLKDHQELARIEMRGGMYETDDGHLGLPVENVWKSIEAGAKSFKLGKDVARALRHAPEVVPIILPGGEIVACDDYMGIPEALYYTSVGVSRRRVMRARPRVLVGWRVVADFYLDESVLPWSKLEPAIERAGKYEGIGERRPLFGTFEAQLLG